MSTRGFLALSLLACLAALFMALPSFVCADGTYRVTEDEGGMYLVTDKDGTWHIDPGNAQYFSVGEMGGYTLSRDHKGVFIKTAAGGKYYVNKKEGDRWEFETPEFSGTQPQAEGAETKVIILEGAHALVPVTLGYGNDKMEVLLLLDTGSTITVLHQEVADRLKLKSIQKAKLMVADGTALDTDIVKLDYVQVGPIRREGIHASVIPHKGRKVQYKGLLGMNFLNGLEYRIDPKKQVIRWKS